MVGLDGASWPMLEAEAAAGHLPAVAELLGRGLHGPLRVAPGFSDATAWSSFSTGLRPEHHGWANVQMLRPGSYELEEVRRDRVSGPPFWQHVSDAGRTVTILDVPKSPRGHSLQGVELVDWLVHGVDGGPPASDPPEFAEEVVRRHGAGHGVDCESFGHSVEWYRSFLDFQAGTTRRKGDLAVEQLRARPADLAVVVFNAAHCVGHQCWHLYDPGHPDRDEALVRSLGDPVSVHYGLLDEQVARLCAEVGEETTVVLFAGLGMGANYFDQPFLDEILHRLDTDRRPAATAQHGLTRAWRRAVPHRLRTAMPSRWHRAALASRERARRGRSFFGLDAGSTSGAVRVNLEGREPAGVVPPESLDAVLDGLEASLLALRDRDTGLPAVREVVRVAGLHTGPEAAAFADLFVHWDDTPVSAVASEEVGVVPRPAPKRSGHHTSGGFWVGAGPGIEADPEPVTIDITDLGSAVAESLGVRIEGTDAGPVPILTGEPGFERGGG
jgi:predicted AlkP superfamily phosphohydrolase/phosphomutase